MNVNELISPDVSIIQEFSKVYHDHLRFQGLEITVFLHPFGNEDVALSNWAIRNPGLLWRVCSLTRFLCRFEYQYSLIITMQCLICWSVVGNKHDLLGAHSCCPLFHIFYSLSDIFKVSINITLSCQNRT